MKMVEMAGVELSQTKSDISYQSATCELVVSANPQRAPQSSGEGCPILAQVVATWSRLSSHLRLAVAAIVASQGGAPAELRC